MMRKLSACAAVLHVAATKIKDSPILSGAQPVYLDGEAWVLSNAAHTITVGASVPGDLVTDLQTAGVIGDPLYQLNFLPEVGAPPAPGAQFGQPIWDNQTWVYTNTFSVPWDPATAGWADVELVFDGVKMAADVSLNGAYVGRVADMFYRYSFPVASLLKGGANEPNTLTLSFFTSNDTSNNEGRWDSCSGGWDWAFYSQTNNPSGPDLHTFSKGIWKSVYVLPIPAQSVGIQHVVPLISYAGDYPTSPLADGNNGLWTVKVNVYFAVPSATTGTLTVTGDWPGANQLSQQFNLPAGNTSAGLNLAANNVNLWWPNGMGGRTLYNVGVKWTPSSAGAPVITDSRRVGFRVLYLVTADDSNPANLTNSEGSGNFTMRWKVNGADMYARGGNIIPMEEMEGRMSDEAHVQLVHSAAAAGFNAFRVWGGGIYGPQAFYDTADELGILMYHDAMYSSDGRIPPAPTPLEDAELRHNIRRLASHPSIGHWDSCNECDPVSQPVYYTFVATVMSQEDPSRPIWPSCPSQGWWSGVHTLTGLPNGNPLIPIGAKGTAAVPSDGVRAPALPDPRPGAALPTVQATETRTVTDEHGTAITMPVATGASCTVQQDVDYDTGTFWVQNPATDPGACCAQCSGNSSCWTAVFFEGQCYWKHPGAKPSYAPGRVAVWPAGNGPIPPSPPIYVTVEAHGPYQHGGGFPAVNGDQNDHGFGANIPITIPPSFTQYGPHAPGTFYSEFGASVWSSFESVAPTLEPVSWGLGGGMAANPAATCQGQFSGVCPGPNPIAQRNYPPHNFIYTYFAPSNGNYAGLAASLNTTGTSNFQRQLYLAVLAQGLEMKADISTRRASPHTATIYWQFNEIWPTGGWGSVEYGTVGHTPGQVLGGRWKTLHHWVASILYKDTFLTCGADGRCLVRNDNAVQGLIGTAYVQILNLRGANGPVAPIATAPIALPRGMGAVQQFCLGKGNTTAGCETIASVLGRSGCAANGTDCMLLTSVLASDGVTVLSKSWELLNTPGTIQAAGALPNPTLSWTVARGLNADGTVNVTVTSTKGSPALFVTLTTLAQGRFSDNAVVIPGGPGAASGAWAEGSAVTVQFHGFPENPDGSSGPIDVDQLASTLRVEHLGQYLP